MQLVCIGDAASAASRGGVSQMLVFVLLFIGMWFLFIAPQRKRQKKHQEMLQKLKNGDRVLLASGIFGKIIKINGGELTLEVAKGVRMEVLRGAVQQQVEEKGNGGEDDIDGDSPPEKPKKK
ncbi:MAG: preprotein translocase subunit YajC [Puniceicoccales bacterium]|jgi:preprotein translocase subunit YajC|nr:preprotein translocase subunit YajC [Puniceicoccales bacterium]